jgi:hypothetical protein
MGGGRRYLLPNDTVDPDKSIGVNSKNGRRDNRNLIDVGITMTSFYQAQASDQFLATTKAICLKTNKKKDEMYL